MAFESVLMRWMKLEPIIQSDSGDVHQFIIWYFAEELQQRVWGLFLEGP